MFVEMLRRFRLVDVLMLDKETFNTSTVKEHPFTAQLPISCSTSQHNKKSKAFFVAVYQGLKFSGFFTPKHNYSCKSS